MEKEIFDISFSHDDIRYTGWVNPSDSLNDSGKPISFHVVLNGTSFGYLSFHHGQWTVNEERPSTLVALAGGQIEMYYSRLEMQRLEKLA